MLSAERQLTYVVSEGYPGMSDKLLVLLRERPEKRDRGAAKAGFMEDEYAWKAEDWMG